MCVPLPAALDAAARGRGAADRRCLEVPAEADQSQGLQGIVHDGPDAAAPADVSGRRVRLLETGGESEAARRHVPASPARVADGELDVGRTTVIKCNQIFFFVPSCVVADPIRARSLVLVAQPLDDCCAVLVGGKTMAAVSPDDL